MWWHVVLVVVLSTTYVVCACRRVTAAHSRTRRTWVLHLLVSYVYFHCQRSIHTPVRTCTVLRYVFVGTGTHCTVPVTAVFHWDHTRYWLYVENVPQKKRTRHTKTENCKKWRRKERKKINRGEWAIKSGLFFNPRIIRMVFVRVFFFFFGRCFVHLVRTSWYMSYINRAGISPKPTPRYRLLFRILGERILSTQIFPCESGTPKNTFFPHFSSLYATFIFSFSWLVTRRRQRQTTTRPTPPVSHVIPSQSSYFSLKFMNIFFTRLSSSSLSLSLLSPLQVSS